MAEVFLGRLHGPHGFERPLVIKRILPHLAADANIVDLFLDEARIIANRHPDPIHVHELGREGDELFIAMECLEGESLSGLCRPPASRLDRMTIRARSSTLEVTAKALRFKATTLGNVAAGP